jgi:hypothetical protein
MSTLPTSSVTTYQSFIMYPAGVCESFPIDGMSMVVPEPKARPNEDIELMIYSSQIYLRVIMNEAHNQLYGSKIIRVPFLYNLITSHRQKQNLR